MKIGNREIGYNQPPFLIAEIGINHNGDLRIAKELIDLAVSSGCDAVKFQKRTVDVVYTAEELARPRENPFGPTNGDLKRGLEFGKAQYDEIDAYCKSKNILWFASPWDEASVDFLEQYNPPCYKIASASITDVALLKHVASKKRPIIASLGMCNDAMVKKVVQILGNNNLILLHCTSTYPSADAELNLNNIPRLIKEYPQHVIGYSGHEPGVYASLVAAALGACVVERHITLDRSMWGSDQAASLEPEGIRRLARSLKTLKVWLGSAKKEILENERPIIQKLRRVDTLAVANA